MKASMAAAVLLALGSVASVAVAANQAVDVTPRVVQPSMSGQDIFRYYCASCHGRDGRGSGPVADSLSTKPANLVQLSIKNGGRFPTERVRDFIASGRPDVPAHGSADMPVWGPIFRSLDVSDKVARQRIENLVRHIRSIQAK